MSTWYKFLIWLSFILALIGCFHTKMEADYLNAKIEYYYTLQETEDELEDIQEATDSFMRIYNSN